MHYVMKRASNALNCTGTAKIEQPNVYMQVVHNRKLLSLYLRTEQQPRTTLLSKATLGPPFPTWPGCHGAATTAGPLESFSR